MDTTQPPTPTIEQMLTNEELNSAHARLLAQWGEEAPDARDEFTHPEDWNPHAWAERYES